MRRWLHGSLFLIALLLLTACAVDTGATTSGATTTSGTSANEAPAADSATPEADADAQTTTDAEADVEVQKIIIGTGSQFPRICFIDEDGNLTGFDVELLRIIDERLPQYEFEFQVLEFTNLLLSLETNKIDVVAHQMEKNPERVEKYLFNSVPYAYWKNKIVVSKENIDAIEGLADVHGKKAFTTPTSANATLLENYLEENPGAFEIVYSSGGANDTPQQISSGRVDFTVAPDFTLPLIDPDGLLKTVGKPLSETEILYIFRQNEEQATALAATIDEVITELRNDGTLSALSIEWLGFDATVDEPQ